ncbi:MAG TPA: hypothetical protein ENF18_07950 [candidate division WOR-3 bacterium]|uniref:Uncharacterized protein n=1 Tax=candidate division WOR-3 bacterium TaxID=2052148 RepID=A0A7C0ZJ71_UNCW3|nr:hypothetical protein [candidate division WOR-3 bacterium]
MDERIYELINKKIDGLITEDEERELIRIFKENPDIEKEFKDMEALKGVMDMLKAKDPDWAWEDYWKSLYNRIERGVAWIFFSIGAIILLTYGAIEWVQSVLKDTEMPLIAKLGVFSLVFGLVVLFVSVVRERIFVSRSDKYSREVKK